VKTIEELRELVRQAWEAESVILWTLPSPSPRPHCVEIKGGKSLFYMSGAYSTVFPGAESEERALEHAFDQAPKGTLAELRERRARDWEKRA
jgi:hypothetical protein